MSKNCIYKIIFINNESLIEIYAKHMGESDMFGFIEVDELLFGENRTLVVDPSEERLKMEFSDVEKTFIPIHSIIRIDQVTQEGASKMKDLKGDGNIHTFPKTSHAFSKKNPD